jgi:hypothetical protein
VLGVVAGQSIFSWLLAGTTPYTLYLFAFVIERRLPLNCLVSYGRNVEITPLFNALLASR